MPPRPDVAAPIGVEEASVGLFEPRRANVKVRVVPDVEEHEKPTLVNLKLISGCGVKRIAIPPAAPDASVNLTVVPMVAARILFPGAAVVSMIW